MIPFDSLSLFALASIALGLAPGPDNIFVLTQSAVNGRMAGVVVTLGLLSGVLVHTTLVALGIAVIFETSRLAFKALKIFGAAYLLYLAVKAFRASAQTIATGQPVREPLTKLYTTGIVMNISNPKVAIFFLAFLPQFTDPDRGSIPAQIFSLGLVFILCTFLVFGTIALLAGSLGGWLKRTPKAQVWLNRGAGVIFVGLALRLMAVEQQ